MSIMYDTLFLSPSSSSDSEESDASCQNQRVLSIEHAESGEMENEDMISSRIHIISYHILYICISLHLQSLKSLPSLPSLRIIRFQAHHHNRAISANSTTYAAKLNPLSMTTTFPLVLNTWSPPFFSLLHRSRLTMAMTKTPAP